MKKVIKAIIKDFRDDWKFLKSLSDGSYNRPKHLQNIQWKQLVKEVFSDKMTYMAILLIVAAVMSGYILASVNFQNACNEFIVEQFYNNTGLRSSLPMIGDHTINLSHLK